MAVFPGHAKDLKGERVRMPCFYEFAIEKAQVVKFATSQNTAFAHGSLADSAVLAQRRGPGPRARRNGAEWRVGGAQMTWERVQNRPNRHKRDSLV